MISNCLKSCFVCVFELEHVYIQDYFEGGSDLNWPECLKGKAWVLPLDHV